MIGAIKDDKVGYEYGAQLSVWWLVATLIGLGLLLFYLNETQSVPIERTPLLLGVLLLLGAATITGLLEQWRSWAGQWFAVLFLTTLLPLSYVWLSFPGLLTWIGLSIPLAMALLGLNAAVVVTIVQTLLLLSLRASGLVAFSAGDFALILTSDWLMLGSLAVLYRLWRQAIRQLWQHYEQNRLSLDEARTRNQTLDQTLDDLRHANRQLDLLNERLAALRQAAEEAQRAKTAFVAKVSHEFRTPLNMIIGLTDLLVETPEVYGGKLPPPLLHDLGIVHRNCAHLASMIDDVLDLSQAEAARLTLHKEWADLSEDIQVAVAVVEPLLHKKQLRLDVLLPNELPQVYCDRKRVRQVILNLLSNAARYTTQGGVKIEAVVRNDDLLIYVADTGPGISDEDRERIFEPFFQANPQSVGQSGSGLGLTISKQFIEMHNGRLWVESEVGLGSSFYFSLPRSQPMLPIAHAGRWIREGWMWQERVQRSPLPHQPYSTRIVVYDRTGALIPLFNNLGNGISEQIEVVERPSLAEAVAECQACPSHLLLINASKPDLNKLIEEARSAASDTPIAGTTISSSVDQILETSVLEYLIKPVTRADIFEVWRRVQLPRKRVLIVDDELEVRELLIRMLLTYDNALEIFEAATGEAALQALCAYHPDLMLLDMMLPDMTGVQLIEQKLLKPTICDIPTVVISAQDPSSQPTTSPMLVTALAGGLTFEKLLHCALEFSDVMLSTEEVPFPERV
ncbi:MAG: hybrid sensor histidine kinase/response regulator [Caldilineaceae bacterium]